MKNKVKMLNTDAAQKFMLENQDVRGVIVHLTESYQVILKQHNYPPIVQKFLGEVLLASTLLAETIKLNGRMTIQFQSDGAIKLLVAQINDRGHLRGLAQWDVNATDAELESGLGEGQLVITIFDNNQLEPLQSIVSLEKRSITEALSFYFLQSEQLPTQFSFAVNEEYAVGMLLQLLPEKINTERQASWKLLIEHVKEINPAELFYDNNASFLMYYFPEDEIRLFDARELKFECGCSVEKMANAISVMGEIEANLILKEKAEILVTCEYCNREFGFDREKVEGIFRIH